MEKSAFEAVFVGDIWPIMIAPRHPCELSPDIAARMFVSNCYIQFHPITYTHELIGVLSVDK